MKQKKEGRKVKDNDTKLRELNDILKNIISQESKQMKREQKGQKIYVRKLQVKTSLI